MALTSPVRVFWLSLKSFPLVRQRVFRRCWGGTVSGVDSGSLWSARAVIRGGAPVAKLSVLRLFGADEFARELDCWRAALRRETSRGH